MKDLIKEYLENGYHTKYKNVEINWCDKDKIDIDVVFQYENKFGDTMKTDVIINVWDILAFVNNKINDK